MAGINDVSIPANLGASDAAMGSAFGAQNVSPSAGASAGDVMGMNLLGQAGAAVCQTIGAIWGYCLQGEMISLQKEAQMSTLDHNKNLDKIKTDDGLDEVAHKERLLENMKVANEKGLAAKEELAKAEGQKRIVDEQISQRKTTIESGKINEKLLSKLFDPRGNYRYGQPTDPSLKAVGNS